VTVRLYEVGDSLDNEAIDESDEEVGDEEE
jgi:hypothetical protein